MTSSDSRRLVVETSNGPVAGFIDTFSLGDVSRGRDIVENGVDGGQAGVKKWLVSKTVPVCPGRLILLACRLRPRKLTLTTCFPPGVLQGIPYAQAERWTRPRAPDAWTEVKDALEFGQVHASEPPRRTL